MAMITPPSRSPVLRAMDALNGKTPTRPEVAAAPAKPEIRKAAPAVAPKAASKKAKAKRPR